MSGKYTLTEQDLEQVTKIETKWNEYERGYCDDCLYSALSHWEKHQAHYHECHDCEQNDNISGEENGKEDIMALINIIKKMQVDNYINHKQIEFVKSFDNK